MPKYGLGRELAPGVAKLEKSSERGRSRCRSRDRVLPIRRKQHEQSRAPFRCRIQGMMGGEKRVERVTQVILSHERHAREVASVSQSREIDLSSLDVVAGHVELEAPQSLNRDSLAQAGELVRSMQHQAGRRPVKKSPVLQADRFR